MDFSVFDNQNVKNHINMLEQAYKSGASAGAIGHLENQLNQAIQDAGASPAVSGPKPPVSAAPAPLASSSPPPPPPPPPVPPLPTFTRMTAPNKNIKPAPSDIIQFDDSAVNIALIQDLLYEDIGAVELANISRTDLIDGQDVLYSPIRNLSSVRREFNPNNIIATSYSTDYFSRFGIDLDSRGVYEPYFDEDGNLIIEIETVNDGEEIQVQILSSGTINIIEEL